jgi:hypothetical protein
VSGGVLDDESLVACDAGKYFRLLDRPFTDVGPILFRVLLLCVRRGPSSFPVVGELFEEGRLEIRRLHTVRHAHKIGTRHTVKVGRSAGLEVSAASGSCSAASWARVVPARRAEAYSAAWRRILSKRGQ